MANVQITQLPIAQSLTGTESVPIVQNGMTVQTTTSAISATPLLNYTFLTVGLQSGLSNSRYFSTDSNLTITDNGAQSYYRISLNGALAQFNTLSNGFVVKNGTSTLTNVVLQGTSDQITVVNGDGLSGNPTLSISSNPTLPGNSYVQLPQGTTAQRGSPFYGALRYNTETSLLEAYTSVSGWGAINSTPGAVLTFSAGTTGLTPSTPSTGGIVLDGILNVLNGGTGTTTSTGTGNVVLSDSPTFTGAITSTGTLQLTGSASSAQNIATSQVIGALTIGGALATGILTFGRSTQSQIINIGTGITANGKTKTINIGVGVSVSPTVRINIGQRSSGGYTNINLTATDLNLDATNIIFTSPSLIIPSLLFQTFSAVADLPIGYQGYRAMVYDASNPVVGTTVVGGGTTTVPVYYDGFNWLCDAGSSGAVQTFSGGTTGFTPSTATSGAVTLAGTLVVGNGGTGLTLLTTGYIPYGNGTGALSSVSTLNYNATNTAFNAPTFSTSSTTNTTPTLSFNASNTSMASGATISEGFLQTLLQNKSATAGASTNYILSNNLGTDSTYYGEFGMNSSIYSASTPVDFFSINNGIYFSGHDGDVTVGSGNGFKTYLAWGTTGQSAHVINASGAIGLNTNLGTTPALSGTTNFGNANQFIQSSGSAATPVWSSVLNGVSIGATTASTGAFTSLTATSRLSGGVLSTSAGQTSVQTLTLSGSSQTFSVSLAGQTLATGQVYRVRAYGTLAAISSANVRQVQFTPIWGATSLSSLTSSAVLASVAQTTNWQLEFTLTASSAISLLTTGQLINRYASATAIAIDNLNLASTTSLTSASTLTIGVISSGTATADVLNVNSVIIERLV